jgi:thioredoxin 1
MAEQSNVTHLTDDNFDQEVTKHNAPVLVDFWAAWCAPCKAIAPHIEALANEYKGQVKVAKLNVDEQPNTAGNWGVRALPTILLFKNGQVVDQVVGAVPKNRLDSMIKAHL